MTNYEALETMKKIMDLRGYSLGTKKNYLTYVAYFERQFSIPFKEITNNHIRDFLHYEIIQKGMSSQYINCIYSAIRILFEGALEREWNIKNLPRTKKKYKIPKILTREEIKSLIQSLENLKHKAYILLAYSAGLRLNEIANLKISDIDSKNMLILIRQGKGNKDRYAILSSNTLTLLRNYYKQYRPKEWLFEGQKSQRPISCKTLQAKVKAGIKNNATFHSLRHAFATHLIEEGSNLVSVKDLLGHRHINTTSQYIHLANKNGSLSTKSPADMIGGIYND